MIQQGSVDAGDRVAPADVDPIIDTVIEILDTEGYEAVQLREVARRARVSLTTIYRRFPTRDDLIAAALSWWMDTHRYAHVATAPQQGASDDLYDGLMHVFRALFEPWERHPRLLRAYVRAQAAPGGQQLTDHGFDVVEPAARAILGRAEPGFAADIEAVLSAVVYGLLAQFADGTISVTGILPRLERAIYWLAEGESAARRRARSRKRK